MSLHVWLRFVPLLLLAGLCGFAALRPTPVHACSCALIGDLSDAIASTEVIFAGTVVGVNTLSQRLFNSDPRFTFAVSAAWKGTESARVVVRTGRGGGDCGFGFVTGMDYLVYATDADHSPLTSNDLSTGICTRTTPLMRADDDLALLGDGVKPQAAPPESGSFVLVTVLAGVALALGLAGVLYRRRRSVRD